MTKYIVDLETNGLLPGVTKVHCIGVKKVGGGYSYLFGPDEIQEGLDFISSVPCLIGHNILGFDIPVINKLYPDWCYSGAVRDTLVMSRVKYADRKNQDFMLEKFPPNLVGSHSLKAWGLRYGCHKGDYGDRENAWDEYTDEMGEYCMQDLNVTERLWDDVSSLPDTCVELEQDFALVLEEQMRAGFAFDVDGGQSLYAKLIARRTELEEELISVFPPKETPMKSREYWSNPDTGERYRIKGEAAVKERAALLPGPCKVRVEEFNPNSRVQIADALKLRYGWKPDDFTPDGRAKVDEAVLSRLDYPEAKLLSEYLMITKRLGMLGDGKAAWLKLEKKGRIYGRINHNGAVSGRCTHSRPNIAQACSVNSAYGKECRELFTVPPGYVLVGADLAQVELRILAHYTSRWSNEYVDAILEGDIHTVNQIAAGLEGDPKGRAKAKTLIYCTLYGGGPAKIGQTIGVSPKEGRILQQKLLNGMPALRQLINKVKEVFASTGMLTGLDGRPLHCRSQHSALNTLLQSGAAVCMKKATVLANESFRSHGWTDKDVVQVAHVHDEIQVQVRTDYAREVGEILVNSFRKAGTYFELRCPLDGDYKVGKNWAETH